MFLAAVVALLMTPAVSTAVADDYVGVSVGTLFTADRSLVPGGGEQLDRLAQSGMPVARVDATWHNLEPFGPAPGFARNWVAGDRIAAALAARGVRWFPVLGYATPWSTTVAGTDKAAPANQDWFASYAAGIADRYGPGGIFWKAHPELPNLPVTAMELWNEPNLAAYWHPGPDPAAYASLYLTTHAAVHAVAPSVQLVTGGLSPYAQPDQFVREMVAAQPSLASVLDGVGLHPYAAGPTGVVDEITSLRSTLRSLGAGTVPISVTELGWPRPNQSPNAAFALPDDTRAGAVSLVADALRGSDCGIDRLLFFTLQTPESNPVEQEDWFGLLHADGTPTSAFGAMSAAAARSTTPTAPSLAMCGSAARPASPLALTLQASAKRDRAGRTCATATVAYRGQPVNRIPVTFRQRRLTVQLNTDDAGTASRCFSAKARVKVSARAGAWAASAVATV
jgi:hypothetical protein